MDMFKQTMDLLHRTILLTSSLFLIACNNGEKNTSEETQDNDVVTTIQDSNNKNNVERSTSIPSSSLPALTAQTLALNGDKYLLLSPSLKAGSSVKHLNTNEIGTVMGTLFVTINSEDVLRQLAGRFNYSSISADVYEVVPLDRDAELLDVYKELQELPYLTNVELRIMFFNPSDRATKQIH